MDVSKGYVISLQDILKSANGGEVNLE